MTNTKKRKANTLSLFDLMEMFPDNQAAVDFFEGLRWGEKMYCPKCGGHHKITPNKQRPNMYWCGDCRGYFSVKTETVMEASNLPIRKWIYAVYLLVTARKGISSLQLSKEIRISQPSAWFMLQRIREACDHDGGKLFGFVEIDETYMGGKEANKHAHKRLDVKGGTGGKVAVLGMRERGGRTKAMPIPDTTKETLHKAIRENVRPGSTLCTDDNPSYNGAAHRHLSVNHSAKEYVNGMAHTNGIESVWAVLKRGHDGVYHQMSTKHLKRYVNEFAFRLNEGNVQLDTIDRIKALCSAMVGKTMPYKVLVS